MMITHIIYKQEQPNAKSDIGANRHIKSSIGSNSNCGGSNNTSNNQRQEQQQTTMKQLSTNICSEPNKRTDNNSKKKKKKLLATWTKQSRPTDVTNKKKTLRRLADRQPNKQTNKQPRQGRPRDRSHLAAVARTSSDLAPGYCY